MKKIITTTESVSLQMFKPVHGIYQHLTKGTREKRQDAIIEGDETTEELNTRGDVTQDIGPAKRLSQVSTAKQLEPSKRETQATVVKKTVQSAQRHTSNSVRSWSTIKDGDTETRAQQNSSNDQESGVGTGAVHAPIENAVSHTTTIRAKQRDISEGASRVHPQNTRDEKESFQKTSSIVSDGDAIRDSRLQKAAQNIEEVRRPSVSVNAFVGAAHSDVEELPAIDINEKKSNLDTDLTKNEMAQRVFHETSAQLENTSLPERQSELLSTAHDELVDSVIDPIRSTQIRSSKLQRGPNVQVRDNEMEISHPESFDEQLEAIKNNIQSIDTTTNPNRSTDIDFKEQTSQGNPVGLEVTNVQSDTELQFIEMGNTRREIYSQTTIEDTALEKMHDSGVLENREPNDAIIDALLTQDRESELQQIGINEAYEKQVTRTSLENGKVSPPKLNTALKEPKQIISKPMIFDERLVKRSKRTGIEKRINNVPNVLTVDEEVVGENGPSGITEEDQATNRSTTMGPSISERSSSGPQSIGVEQISTVVSMEGFSAQDSSMVLESRRPVTTNTAVNEATSLPSHSGKSISKSDVQKIFESLIRDAAEQNGLEV